jgi:RNA polymerase sigma-70 factor (ECF subfamily)
MPDADTDAVAAFRRGDHAAFETIYRRHAARVMAFAFCLCRDRCEAEDLVQETFLGAYQGRHTYRGRSGLLPWLLGIAWRRRRDAMRAPRPAPMELRETDAITDGMAARALDTVLLERAIALLPPVLAEAFHLVMVQGLTHREAAEVLGRPIGTVKWFTASAVRRLREALRDEPATDREPVSVELARPIPGV